MSGRGTAWDRLGKSGHRPGFANGDFSPMAFLQWRTGTCLLCDVPLSPPKGTDSPVWCPIPSSWMCYPIGFQCLCLTSHHAFCLHTSCPHRSPASAQCVMGSPWHCWAFQETSGLVPWLAEAAFVPVSPRSGRAEVDDVLAAIRPTTCLVSIMLANNETGVIMVSLRAASGTGWGHPRKKVLETVPGTQNLFPPASLLQS